MESITYVENKNHVVITGAHRISLSAGLRGERGLDGEQGQDGQDGEAGADGLSAYQVAVANGFVGTQVEWLASLEGAQGIQGLKGDKGDKGDAGPALGEVAAVAPVNPALNYVWIDTSN